jgi:hypothetical protein
VAALTKDGETPTPYRAVLVQHKRVLLPTGCLHREYTIKGSDELWLVLVEAMRKAELLQRSRRGQGLKVERK